MTLSAPFPWFGGKRRVAKLVWGRFGDVPNYVEPFAGSLAVLLGRPTPPHVETVNDKDAYLANFWRSLQHDPECVAQWADWPVNETDLHARHRWLVEQADFRERMLRDPDFYDPRIAGWWVWGLCMWIGSGWCARPEWMGRGNASRAARGVRRDVNSTLTYDQIRRRAGTSQTEAVWLQRPILEDGRGVHKRIQLPCGSGHGVDQDLEGIGRMRHTSDAGTGVHKASVPAQVPHLSGDGQGVHRKVPELGPHRGEHRDAVRVQIPDLGGDSGATGRGMNASARSGLYDWFEALAARLRRVRVCCGEWDRILGPSPTSKIGITGVLLDPPYGVEGRVDVYNHESRDLSAQVRQWAIEHGDDPLLRIALCGYEGEHDMPANWSVVAWKAHGGYAGQRKNGTNDNPNRERIWFSPHCLPARQRGLFDEDVA